MASFLRYWCQPIPWPYYVVSSLFEAPGVCHFLAKTESCTLTPTPCLRKTPRIIFSPSLLSKRISNSSAFHVYFTKPGAPGDGLNAIPFTFLVPPTISDFMLIFLHGFLFHILRSSSPVVFSLPIFSFFLEDFPIFPFPHKVLYLSRSFPLCFF